MMKAVVVLGGLLLLLGACAGGQPISGPTDPNYTACFKAPSQQSIAEQNYCNRLRRDAA